MIQKSASRSGRALDGRPTAKSIVMRVPLLRNSTVLITGGTGSFGHRVATRMLEQGPREIRIFSRDEKKQWEMQHRHPDFRYFIGDVRDAQSLTHAVRGADYIFHAAALKQVPTCETFPWEAVQTNVHGAYNLCRVARESGVKVVVALSTDKAVKPVNAMGMSKAMMEKLICSQNRIEGFPVFCCVRYGNVVGSRGSVVPLFMKLIAERQPLTVTVSHMTRFLMTLDQSVDLVFRAMTTARGGEIFVRHAPACTVLDLAKALARKYSALGLDHPITEIGARPGEKLHEILVNEYEMQRAEDKDGYFIIQPEYPERATRALNGRSFGEEYTSANTTQLTNIDDILALLGMTAEAESHRSLELERVTPIGNVLRRK